MSPAAPRAHWFGELSLFARKHALGRTPRECTEIRAVVDAYRNSDEALTAEAYTVAQDRIRAITTRTKA